MTFDSKYSVKQFFAILFFAFVVGFFLSVVCTNAQVINLEKEISGSSSTPQQILGSDALNRDEMREVLSKISDEQARKILLDELEKKIREREAAEEQKAALGVLETFALWGQLLVKDLAGKIPSLAKVPEQFSLIFENYTAERGDVSLWWLLISFIVTMVLGALAFYLVDRLLKRFHDRIFELEPETLWQKFKIISKLFAIRWLRILAFLATGYIVNYLLNNSIEPDYFIVDIMLRAIGWVMLTVIVVRFIFAPQKPSLRLCHVDDEAAKFLAFRIVLIFAWTTFTTNIMFRLQRFGYELGGTQLGFWFNLIYTLLIIDTIWRARKAISQMIAGAGDVDPNWLRFSKIWPTLAIAIVAVQWLIIELFVATGNVTSLSQVAINTTLVMVLFLPLLETAIPALCVSIWPIDNSQTEARQKVRKLLHDFAQKIARVLLLFLALIFMLELWGVDFDDLKSNSGIVGQIITVVIELSSIFFMAYFFWIFLGYITERQVTLERAAIEEDPSRSGGLGITRLDTVVPLIRGLGRIAIILFVVFEILYLLNLNVVTLLAGAGVVGLAVGFGAQALIRDIISGLFFLIDDAFRKDEYIDIGTNMGTVERISIRSMQLRHETGLLITIPFGEVKTVVNYSRDWGIMRLHLRVPFDTDLVKLGEMINQTGEELLQDPDIGDKFTVKLTSLGAVNTDESAVIFRVAYMTKALDQWPMRGPVYAAIRNMFEREGFQFAANEVAIRPAAIDSSTRFPPDGKVNQKSAGQAENQQPDEEISSRQHDRVEAIDQDQN